MKKSVLFLFTFILVNVYSQQNVKSFNFKKGEVLDIILLTGSPEFKEGFEKYKKTILPVGFEYGYQPQPGFKASKLILGNYLPKSFLIGKWGNKEKRENFLENIVNRVPDFHKQRRSTFAYFGLSYYTLSKDLKFTVNLNTYNVVTSFWKKNNTDFYTITKQWEKDVFATGGKFILKLPKGISPVGYNYNPDLFTIIEWKNKSDYEKFVEKHPLGFYSKLKNVHQFIID